MGLLRWVEATAGSKFLKAEIVNLDMDFIDLCKGRYWDGSTFCFQLKFSIHERIVKSNGFSHQLLAPNGVHIYCKDVEEGKEIAEVIYRRIIGALSEQINKSAEPVKCEMTKHKTKYDFLEQLDNIQTYENLNKILYKKFCKNTKRKSEKLLSLLKKRGIVGKVWYSRLRHCYGWMFGYNGGQPYPMGLSYQQAIDFINSGSLDFCKSVG